MKKSKDDWIDGYIDRRQGHRKTPDPEIKYHLLWSAVFAVVSLGLVIFFGMAWWTQ